MSELLRVTVIEENPAAYVSRHSTVELEFSHLTQDSGNVSWLVDAAGERLFVKTAGADLPPRPGGGVPFFDHAGRVRLLRNAIELARSCAHPSLPALRNVVETPRGPMLVYEAASGELIGVPAAERADPSSSYQRFAHLPGDDLLRVFDTLLGLHRELADAGWVASDLYDGCLLVDFTTLRLHVIDLDNYRRGSFSNEMGRMFGATRFMAPEEFQLGATIDQRTTVFTLGRHVWHFATRLTESGKHFCGSQRLTGVVRRAIEPSPQDRYPTVAAFADDWSRARLLE